MKKTNKKKLVFTTLGSLATIIAPVAAVISCGQETKKDLIIGIRAEDQPLWNNIAREFKKATGKTVGFKWVYSQDKNYALWSSSNSMPDVAIADSGVATRGIAKNWFQTIDLKNIIENKDFQIKSTGDYEEKKIDFNSKYFELAMMRTMESASDAGKYNGLSVIYSPKITYAWKAFPKKDGTKLNLLDGSKPLKWFVVNQAGLAMEEVDFGTNPSESPLYSLNSDKHKLMNNHKDIQEFISRAISANDLKFNNLKYSFDTTFASGSDAKLRVISTGMPGFKQRVASVGKILIDLVKENKNDLKIDAFKLLNSVFADNAIPYSTLAFGEKQWQTTQALVDSTESNMDSKNRLDDSKVFSGTDGILNDEKRIRTTRALTLPTSSMTMYELINYLSVFGIARKDFASSSGAFPKKEDAQQGFAKFYTLMLPNGALWQKSKIVAKVADTLKIDKSKVSDYITTFGQPVQETNIDGYAVAKSISGSKLTLAKKFLRFLVQKKAAADLTGSKAVSTVRLAQGLQSSKDAMTTKGLDGAGTKPLVAQSIQEIVGIDWAIAKQSFNSKSKTQNTGDIYDTYNNNYMEGSQFNGNLGFTPQQFLTNILKYNNAFQDALDV